MIDCHTHVGEQGKHIADASMNDTYRVWGFSRLPARYGAGHCRRVDLTSRSVLSQRTLADAEVHLMGRADRSLPFARSLGFGGVWTADTLPDLRWDAVIDASNAPRLTAKALELVEPGKRVVYIGLAGSPSLIDTCGLAFRTSPRSASLGGSAGLSGAIDAYARGDVDPAPLVAATVRLEGLAPVLAGEFPGGAGPGPKIHIAIQGGSQ